MGVVRVYRGAPRQDYFTTKTAALAVSFRKSMFETTEKILADLHHYKK